MSTIQRAQAIGKTGDPFWVDVISAYETVLNHHDQNLRVERGDKAADVYHASDGVAVVIVITPLAGEEQSSTEIKTHAGYSDKTEKAMRGDN
jgi:hypothetical protein